MRWFIVAASCIVFVCTSLGLPGQTEAKKPSAPQVKKKCVYECHCVVSLKGKRFDENFEVCAGCIIGGETGKAKANRKCEAKYSGWDVCKCTACYKTQGTCYE